VNNVVYYDGNATPHRKRLFQDVCGKEEIKQINWPATFPDVNIIENQKWLPS